MILYISQFWLSNKRIGTLNVYFSCNVQVVEDKGYVFSHSGFEEYDLVLNKIVAMVQNWIIGQEPKKESLVRIISEVKGEVP